MKRQQKYPDTKTFHYYNANPHNKLSGDCVIRAVATVLEQSWEQTLKEMCDIGIKYGYVPTDDKVIARYMENKGWYKHRQPRKFNNTKFTGKEFCECVQKTDFIDQFLCLEPAVIPYVGIKKILANIGGHHIVAIIDGKVNDIWDSTDGCIGNVWVKEV